jgi:hypothetical protein
MPPGAAAQEAAPLFDTKAVQAVLQPEEIVFAFALAEPDSFRWVISREYLVFDRIAGRTAIEKAAIRLRGLRDTPASDDARRAASKQLGAMLFDKITTADDRPVIVVPDGVLHDVRFELLELQGRMVGERHRVSYSPSLDAFVQFRRARNNDEAAMAPLALAFGFALAAFLVVVAKVRNSAQIR